jgi:hypothetical protein
MASAITVVASFSTVSALVLARRTVRLPLRLPNRMSNDAVVTMPRRVMHPAATPRRSTRRRTMPQRPLLCAIAWRGNRATRGATPLCRRRRCVEGRRCVLFGHKRALPDGIAIDCHERPWSFRQRSRQLGQALLNLHNRYRTWSPLAALRRRTSAWWSFHRSEVRFADFSACGSGRDSVSAALRECALSNGLSLDSARELWHESRDSRKRAIDAECRCLI